MLRNGDGLPLKVRKCPGAVDDMEVVSLVLHLTGFYALGAMAIRFHRSETRDGACGLALFTAFACGWDEFAMMNLLLPLFSYVSKMHHLPLQAAVACWCISFCGACVKNAVRNMRLLARILRGKSRWRLETVASDAACSVCLEPANSACRLPGCGHVFCSGCIVAWLDRSGTCPNCRTAAHSI